MTTGAGSADHRISRPVAESRFAAEAKGISTDDYKLIHQDLSRREVERRLAAGADPLELVLRASRLAYAWGHFQGYNEGSSRATHEMVMDQIRRRRAER